MILIVGLPCMVNKCIEYEDTLIGDVVTQIRNKSNQELKPEDAVQLRYSFSITQFQHIVLAVTATFVTVGVSTWSCIYYNFSDLFSLE